MSAYTSLMQDQMFSKLQQLEDAMRPYRDFERMRHGALGTALLNASYPLQNALDATLRAEERLMSSIKHAIPPNALEDVIKKLEAQVAIPDRLFPKLPDFQAVIDKMVAHKALPTPTWLRLPEIQLAIDKMVARTTFPDIPDSLTQVARALDAVNHALVRRHEELTRVMSPHLEQAAALAKTVEKAFGPAIARSTSADWARVIELAQRWENGEDDALGITPSSETSSADVSTTLMLFLADPAFNTVTDKSTPPGEQIRSWLLLAAKYGVVVLFFALAYLNDYVKATIANLTTPYWESQLKQLNPPKPLTPKEAMEATRQAIQGSPAALQAHRYRWATQDPLEIRSTPNSRVRVSAKLSKSRLVFVIDQQKDWSLIEYQDDETQETMKGWVFSRYLRKL